MRPKRLTLIGLAALAVVTLALVALAFVRPAVDRGASQAAYTPPMLFPSQTASAPIRFAVVGDSISQGDSPDFQAGRTGSLSWVTYAKSPSLVFAGGWAVKGSTTAAMAANVQKVDADVLVIVAGTNDLGKLSFADTTANLDKIVAAFGAKRVVVSAIPPYNPSPGLAVAYNASLRDLAQARGWTFVDATAGVRNGDVYASGMTGSDGVHPTQQAAQIIGKALAAAIAS